MSYALSGVAINHFDESCPCTHVVFDGQTRGVGHRMHSLGRKTTSRMQTDPVLPQGLPLSFEFHGRLPLAFLVDAAPAMGSSIGGRLLAFSQHRLQCGAAALLRDAECSA